MRLYDATGNNPLVPRIFALERKGLSFDVTPVDIRNMENRRLAYRRVNARGELPALELDDGRVITEVTAICEYLDEVSTSTGTPSLFGASAAERAATRMWLRRADMEIAQPLIRWWRDDPATIDFYQGSRLPNPDGRHLTKVDVNVALNRLEDELEGKTWLAGDRFSAADIHLYGLVAPFIGMGVAWIDVPGRRNVAAWFKRMDEREAVQKALTPFTGPVSC